MFSNKPYTFDKVVRMVLALLACVAAFLLLHRLSGVLLPFLVSWILAYLLHPVVCFFQYKCRLKSRVLSVIVTLVLLVGLLVGLGYIIIPMVSEEISKVGVLIGNFMQNLDTRSILPASWNRLLESEIQRFDLQKILHNKDFMTAVQKIAPHLWNFLSSSVSALMGLTVVFICLLYLIFLLLDFEELSNNWVNLIPTQYREMLRDVVSDMEREMNRYFRGQALVALCVGILFSIGLSIIRLPLAIVIGFTIGMLSMVPYLHTLGILPCALMGILEAQETGTDLWIVALEITAVFLVVQCIEDMILTPKIMGNITGLHPAIILLALSIWGSLLGMVGMIIALPMTTLIISYYKRFVLKEDNPFNFPTSSRKSLDVPKS